MKSVTVLFLLITLPAWAQDFGTVTISRVTSVYDADTFRADIADWPPVVGSHVPIRVKAVDAPEIRGKCPREKEAARAAKAYTVALLRQARTIELRNIQRGKYFRLLAEVWVDGRNLAENLIQAGHARPYFGGTRLGWCTRTTR